MRELREGQLINGSIRLDTILGRGGMGSLWMAYHLRLKVRVVVKFIAAELAGNPEAMARFQREAAATMAAKSAYVVQLLDYGFTEDMVPFIAMEYLEGENLGTRIARVGRIAPQDFVEILKQTCKGLTRAHAQGIIHRDIKPENIFLTYVDDELAVKLLDFGIAKADSASLDCPSTRTGVFLGTVYYMSPEQTMGASGVDYRSDLWSLGVVAYNALTGVLPFEADAIGTLVEQITSAPVVPPSQHWPALGSAIDDWMSRALARDVNARFASAKDMAAAFEIAAAHQATWAAAITMESSKDPWRNPPHMPQAGAVANAVSPVTPLQAIDSPVGYSTIPRVGPLAKSIASSPAQFADVTAPPMSSSADTAALASRGRVVDMPKKSGRPLLIGVGAGIGIALVFTVILARQSAVPLAHTAGTGKGESAASAPSLEVAVAMPPSSLRIPEPASAPSSASVLASSATPASGSRAPSVITRRPAPKPTAHVNDSNPFDGTY